MFKFLAYEKFYLLSLILRRLWHNGDVPKQPLIIFGSGQIAEVAHFYFEAFSNFTVEAFVVDDEYFTKPVLFSKKCHKFSDVINKPSFTQANWFVAISYKRFNLIRQRKVEQLGSLNFKLINFIHPSSKISVDLSEKYNLFILEHNVIQPFVEFGNNIFLWTNNHIGHHSRIGSNTFISSGVVISGSCQIGDNSFFGVNSTIIDNLSIGTRSWIGPGKTITDNLNDKSKII